MNEPVIWFNSDSKSNQLEQITSAEVKNIWNYDGDANTLASLNSQ